MLVIGRATQQSVLIKVPPSEHEQVVKVTVVRAEKTIRLGFDAELGVVILREELVTEEAANDQE